MCMVDSTLLIFNCESYSTIQLCCGNISWECVHCSSYLFILNKQENMHEQGHYLCITKQRGNLISWKILTIHGKLYWYSELCSVFYISHFIYLRQFNFSYPMSNNLFLLLSRIGYRICWYRSTVVELLVI